MPYRNVSISAVILLFLAVIAWTIAYGPAKRSFVSPERTVTVRSADELDRLWDTSGVHGRTAVIFARHLNHQFSGIAFPETDYLDKAMRNGIVRKTFFVVPDRFWSNVVLENRAWRLYIVNPTVTDTGFMILHEAGRIHVMPLSKYIPSNEKALVVFEPAIWTLQEKSRIDGFLRTGQLATDLKVIVNGTMQDFSVLPADRTP